jgi:hypothetical protein
VRRLFQRNEAKERVDRGQSAISAACAVALAFLKMLQEVDDEGSIYVVK